jgi:5-enolpyruvylshikimate-3-phosphate synthase
VNERYLGNSAIQEKEQKIKDSAGSGDTASMIKGGGYLGARTRPAHNQKEISVGHGGCVP